MIDKNDRYAKKEVTTNKNDCSSVLVGTLYHFQSKFDPALDYSKEWLYKTLIFTFNLLDWKSFIHL